MSQVQPVDDVYPSPNTIQPQHSSHSNGSFGPVFIVLGVIVVLTIIATVLGRICSRRRGHGHGHGHSSSGKAEQPHHAHGGGNKKAGKSAATRPHDKFATGPEGDIEFGFDKRIPTSKVADNGDHPRGPKPSHNGEHKGHVRFADDHREFRAGP